MYFSMDALFFSLMTYTHLVSMIFIPLGMEAFMTLVNTPYFCNWECFFRLASAHFAALGDDRACSSVAWSGSIPTAWALAFSVGFCSLVENLLPTFLSHSAAVLYFFRCARGSSICWSCLGVSSTVSCYEFSSVSDSLPWVSLSLMALRFLTILKLPMGVMTWYVLKVVVYPMIRPSHDRGAILADALVP